MANFVWQSNEITFLRENAHRLKDKDLAERLSAMSGRTISLNCIRKKRQRLGIRKAPGRGVLRIVK